MRGLREDFPLASWADFEPTLQEIRRKYAESTETLDDGRVFHDTEHMLFRGQANSDWKLQTTLERRTSDSMNIDSYVEAATRYAPEIEAYSGKRWSGTDYTSVKASLKNTDSLYADLPCYEYMVYLRHHGFASPLLDWTRSPYIAAFFAFASMPSCERVAIFAFIETQGYGKYAEGGTPTIRSFGPFVRTDPRHFSQQAEYTMATQYRDEKHFFCSHHDAVALENPIVDQDVLVRVTLPASERTNALTYLDEHNITHHSLFHDETSLIATMDTREFDVRRPSLNRHRQTSRANLPEPRHCKPG
ncbi:MAG: FRG domain-containing protein [Planctomycetota bacterium]